MIDLLKAIAIICVLLLHAFPGNPASSFLSLSIPLFFLIMAYNFYGSFKRNYRGSLWEYYPGYLRDKAARYLPSLILMVALTYLFLNKPIEQAPVDVFTRLFKLFYSPLVGPGSWFVPALIQFVWFFPLVVWLVKDRFNLPARLPFRSTTPIDWIGRASWQIYLVQCLVFWLLPVELAPLGLVLSIIGGFVLYLLEKVVKREFSYMLE